MHIKRNFNAFPFPSSFPSSGCGQVVAHGIATVQFMTKYFPKNFPGDPGYDLSIYRHARVSPHAIYPPVKSPSEQVLYIKANRKSIGFKKSNILY